MSQIQISLIIKINNLLTKNIIKLGNLLVKILAKTKRNEKNHRNIKREDNSEMSLLPSFYK